MQPFTFCFRAYQKKRHFFFIFTRIDLAEWLVRLAVNAKVATVLGPIPASSDTGESERRQLRQWWVTYRVPTYKRKKSTKIPLFNLGKKFDMVIMRYRYRYSWVWGTLIHEKTHKSKILWHSPFKRWNSLTVRKKRDIYFSIFREHTGVLVAPSCLARVTGSCHPFLQYSSW